ncbi:hypothetical protein AGDE_06065 [Angomonas deanei]|uniref:Vps52 / Sac2 family, putative n=1 Tax=Angomonas deanei TaxID=59799 RepID=A0A7G2C766_9TRYP|nr:hypothetical protein AGDE_06065 [Angomonas deanei]CAD2214934.1 Vps52 / Sac2 family, putative [Angomonas deanei]|eukprot:EPY37868.1 hypothetical protein AGDE_06065 [Angomonas deanei]
MNAENARVSDVAEEALKQIEEIEALMKADTDEDAFAKYLRSGEDLKSVVDQHDSELKQLSSQYIDDHVKQVENIVQLYNELNACDQKIEDFEEEIVTFLRNLEESANDIVLMQQNTETLVRSVSHRRQVSNKIHEVYAALQECDTFCEDIANKEVDRSFLASLREIDHKLLFLSKNKSLQGSAVDNELRPKLKTAAKKAGDKLHKYLTKKMEALASCTTLAEVESAQQSLEQSSQYAYRFLLLYNAPVANDIAKLYINTMVQMYTNHVRTALREVTDAAEVHAHPLNPIVTADELTSILSNRDTGSPKGCQVQAAPLHFPGKVLSTRDRSISQHVRSDAASRVRTLKEATFEENVLPLREIRVRYSKLYFDEKVKEVLNKCDSWTWRFAHFLQQLVNICSSECTFISNFFCIPNESDEAGDFNVAESIARSVLGRVIQTVETALPQEMVLVLNRSSVLASLRFLEVAKQYLCTSLDPVPLVLLSGVLEMTKACLKNNIRTFIRNDTEVLPVVEGLKLSLFQTAPDDSSSTDALITAGKSYLLTLGPHPVVCRVFDVLGQVEYLNCAPFRCETFSGGATDIYDPNVLKYTDQSVPVFLGFISTLAKRHKSRLAQCLFVCNNLYFVFFSLQQISRRNPIPESLAVKDEKETPFIASAGTVTAIEERLQTAFRDFIRVEAGANATESFDYIFSVVQKAEDQLGEAFFADAGATEGKRLPSDLTEERIRTAVTRFGQKHESEMTSSIKRLKSLTTSVFDNYKAVMG